MSTRELGAQVILTILPGYKHSLLLEAGDIVAEHIVNFIHALPDQG